MYFFRLSWNLGSRGHWSIFFCLGHFLNYLLSPSDDFLSSYAHLVDYTGYFPQLVSILSIKHKIFTVDSISYRLVYVYLVNTIYLILPLVDELIRGPHNLTTTHLMMSIRLFPYSILPFSFTTERVESTSFLMTRSLPAFTSSLAW